MTEDLCCWTRKKDYDPEQHSDSDEEPPAQGFQSKRRKNIDEPSESDETPPPYSEIDEPSENDEPPVKVQKKKKKKKNFRVKTVYPEHIYTTKGKLKIRCDKMMMGDDIIYVNTLAGIVLEKDGEKSTRYEFTRTGENYVIVKLD